MRLITVSNRLPLTIKRNCDGFTLHPNSGGLVTGLNCVRSKKDTLSIDSFIWIGNIVDTGLSDQDKQEIATKCRNDFSAVPVFVNEELNKIAYSGFCNNILWPLLHSFSDAVQWNMDYYNKYKEYNELFCSAISSIAEDGDIIWIHDYHLLLLPQLLRTRIGRSVRIGLFLHTPFPDKNIFSSLPCAREILCGMTGADSIGFQIHDYLADFLQTTQEILKMKDFINNYGKFEEELNNEASDEIKELNASSSSDYSIVNKQEGSYEISKSKQKKGSSSINTSKFSKSNTKSKLPSPIYSAIVSTEKNTQKNISGNLEGNQENSKAEKNGQSKDSIKTNQSQDIQEENKSQFMKILENENKLSEKGSENDKKSENDNKKTSADEKSRNTMIISRDANYKNIKPIKCALSSGTTILSNEDRLCRDHLVAAYDIAHRTVCRLGKSDMDYRQKQPKRGILYSPNSIHVGDRKISLHATPIGIDAAVFLEKSKNKEILKRVQQIKDKFKGKKILLGVDRTDYIKGMPLRMEGMKEYIKKYGKDVVLLCVGVPSRLENVEYKALVNKLYHQIGEINSISVDENLVYFLSSSVSFDELVALYCSADVLIVSSIRDGLNLVAMEYVAAKKEGVLLLSKYAGAVSSLPGAVIFNPWNTNEMAEKIDYCLKMDDNERKERYNINAKNVEKFDAVYWAENNIRLMKNE